MEVKCDRCEYTAINKARLNKHIEFTHVLICEICKEWDGGIEYRGENEFARHNQFIHADCDKTLTDEEFSLMITVQREEIEYGPETPRREALVFQPMHN